MLHYSVCVCYPYDGDPQLKWLSGFWWLNDKVLWSVDGDWSPDVTEQHLWARFLYKLKNIPHKAFAKITSKPIFYFMYSNTMYILNNTIIECFDIAFNKTKKKQLSVWSHVTKEEGDSHLFRTCQRRQRSDMKNVLSYKQNQKLYRNQITPLYNHCLSEAGQRNVITWLLQDPPRVHGINQSKRILTNWTWECWNMFFPHRPHIHSFSKKSENQQNINVQICTFVCRQYSWRCTSKATQTHCLEMGETVFKVLNLKGQQIQRGKSEWEWTAPLERCSRFCSQSSVLPPADH